MRRMRSFAIATLLFVAPTLCVLAWQEEMMVEGVLSAIDLESKTLSVKHADDQEMSLKYTDETKIVEQEEKNAQWLKEKTGTKVKVSYKLVEEKPQATRVEVSHASN